MSAISVGRETPSAARRAFSSSVKSRQTALRQAGRESSLGGGSGSERVKEGRERREEGRERRERRGGEGEGREGEGRRERGGEGEGRRGRGRGEGRRGEGRVVKDEEQRQ